MAVLEASAHNPRGLHSGKAERVRVKMQDSAGTRGATVYFDLAAAASSGTAAAVAFGGATNPTSNVILATADHDGGQVSQVFWLIGVLAEDIAAGQEGWCYIRGVVQAMGRATIAAGVGLSAGTGSGFVNNMVNSRIVAISLESTTTGNLFWVALNGIEGFGTGAAATA